MDNSTQSSLPTSPQEKIRLLIIDDEQGIRDLLSYELTSRGYEVVTANDGLEALEKIKADHFHIVISDVKMPRMGGLETLEAIKKMGLGIEVIMTTGFGSVDTAVDCMKKGAYDFIMKPYNLDELTYLIEKAYEKLKLNNEV